MLAALSRRRSRVQVPSGPLSFPRPGSSVGTSVRLKIGRSTVRPRPWPLGPRRAKQTTTSGNARSSFLCPVLHDVRRRSSRGHNATDLARGPLRRSNPQPQRGVVSAPFGAVAMFRSRNTMASAARRSWRRASAVQRFETGAADGPRDRRPDQRAGCRRRVPGRSRGGSACSARRRRIGYRQDHPAAGADGDRADPRVRRPFCPIRPAPRWICPTWASSSCYRAYRSESSSTYPVRRRDCCA